MPKAKEQEQQAGGGLDSLEAEGVVSRYEVSHSRSRRGVYQGSKTRVVLVIPDDRGDDVAALQQKRCRISVEVLPPEQQTMFE